MKSICIIIVAAIVLFGIATHSMHRNQANPYADQIIGSWVMYEGGNVAPEVLSFFANGSGYSYMLSEEFVETDQPPIHIASSFLSTPLSFTWNIQTDVLCVMCLKMELICSTACLSNQTQTDGLSFLFSMILVVVVGFLH